MEYIDKKQNLFLLFGLLVCILFLVIGCTPKQTIQKDNTTIAKNTTLSDSINISVLKTEMYLSNIDYTLSANEIIYMIADLLSKNFNRPLLLPDLKYLINKNEVYANNHWKIYGKYFANRTSFTKEQKSFYTKILNDKITETDIQTVWAMYCPYFPIKDTLLDIIESKARLSEYDMTHAALQIEEIIRNNYCNISDTARINKIKRIAVNRLDNDTKLYISAKDDANFDLLVEQFAFLCYLRQYDLLNKQYIRYVINKQNADGGWQNEKGVSTPHTSVLAYWFLLDAYQNIDKIADY